MLNAGRDPDSGAWMIENDYLRLIATAGRGRAVRLIDKRKDHPGRAEIDFWVREEVQQNALSTTLQGDGVVTLVLSATDWRGRGTWHAWLSLAEGVASVQARLAVFNRGWSPISCSPHICAWPSGSLGIAPVLHAAERYEIGGAVGIVGSMFGYREWSLAAQSTAYLEARILPSALERVDYVTKDVTIQLEGTQMRIASAERHGGCRLVVGSSSEPERTFESTVDLSPDGPNTVDLSALPITPNLFRLRNAHGKMLASNTSPPSEPSAVNPIGAPRSLEGILGDDNALASAERDETTAHAAALARGILLMRVQDWEGALEHLEEAMIRRADNPLAWWAKAWCLRRLDADPSQELANAHYLAPLEPALKGDAFLSAPIDAKPAALMDAWGSDPQPYLEFADLLAHAGLHEARAEWLDEARRRAPCKLIERLLAAAHRQHGRDLAASEHLKAAESAPDIADPFRRSEIDAET